MALNYHCFEVHVCTVLAQRYIQSFSHQKCLRYYLKCQLRLTF